MHLQLLGGFIRWHYREKKGIYSHQTLGMTENKQNSQNSTLKHQKIQTNTNFKVMYFFCWSKPLVANQGTAPSLMTTWASTQK